MISASVSVDVPSLAEGVRFYSEAFGFAKVAEPIPGLAVLRAGDSEICRTPVHLDFHVDDIQAAPAVAFCSDPFGHGFCLTERTKK